MVGILLILVCVPAVCLQHALLLDKNISSTLNSLLNPKKYNKKVRPNIGGHPTLVMVNMHIKSIGPVSEIEESYTMGLYFRQSWYDTRLQFNLPGLDELTMSWLFLNKVWKPDTFFMNGKKSHLHRITSPNKFLRVRNDGLLTYSMRLTISARCKMYLRKFPMDTQNCPLIIGSYGYTRGDVKYKWLNNGVKLEPGIELSQYDLVNITTKNDKIMLRGKEEFSMIKVNLILRRNLGYFVLQMYVPLSLIVSCSWVSFWIDPKAVPARVQLGVTTVLSITTIGFGGGRAALPKVNYATALDWFIILCFAFVFGTIVEYAIINFIDKITTDIKRILEERVKKKNAEDEKDQDVVGSKTSLTPENIISSKQPSSIATTEPSSIISSTKYLIPKICLNLDHPEDFEDIGVDDEEKIKTKIKRKSRSKLTKKSASLPTLRHESFSSNDSHSESQTKYYFHNKKEKERVLRNIINIQKKQIEANVEGEISIVRIVRRNGRLRRSLRIPAKMWKKIKILPNEEDLVNQTEPVQIENFTKLDMLSRKVFPMAFIAAVILYTTFYMYYLPDLSIKEEL